MLPDKGTVTFDGEDLSEAHVRRIGYLPEERGLYPKMKADEHLVFLAALKGLPSREIKEKLAFWAEKLELTSLLSRKVEALSKGQQQKVQLIAALIHDPEFIILDEPFSGFDPVNAEVLKDIILDLKNQGKTLLISTHRMENAEELCDEVVLLNKGKVVLGGSLHSVLSEKSGLFYRVISETPLVSTALFEVVEVKGNQSLIQTKEGLTSNQVLQSLIEQGLILSFVPERKTLKEVFLEKVKA